VTRRALLLLGVAVIAGCARPAPPPPARTTLIGLDGADWRNMLPLVREGKLPVIAALRRAGASGVMLTNPDYRWSPVLWTSIATGVLPDKHGVLHFMARVPGQKEMIPTPSTERRVRALWNFFSESDRTVGFVGWWVTWPAEPVKGFMVSDHFSATRFSLGKDYQRTLDASFYSKETYPEELAARLAPFKVAREAIGRDDLARFANLPQTFVFPDTLAPFDKVSEFAIAHSVDRSHYGAGEMLLREERPELFGIFFEGIDILQHYFWEYMDPDEPWWRPSPEDVAAWGETIERYYRFSDGLVGGLVDAGGDGCSVMIVSDHGFRPSNERFEAKHISGEHRRAAVFVWAGPGVRRGVRAEGVDAVDVAPTILAYHGLPVADDFDGEPSLDLLTASWRAQRPLRTIPTWETGTRVRAEIPAESSARDLEERIRALGYIE
jgi:predicted AlkP superfamily phosphohydrolase/phosphomutase